MRIVRDRVADKREAEYREMDEREIEEWLAGLRKQYGQGRGAGEAIRAMAAGDPKRLCTALLSVLKKEGNAGKRQWLYGQLVACPALLIQLMDPSRMSRKELAELCRNWMAWDNQVDLRLARLTPGRGGGGQLPTETVVRILDVLDEISPGPRLILLLNHLTQHPNRRIAAKATMLVGRRLRNQDWVVRQMENEDGRVRASVVEGLWGDSTAAAQSHLWASLKDKNNRVVGNALIGLGQMGEPGVNEFAKRMLEDPRPPFRWTAAWVMGKIGAPEFVEHLERARGDKEAHVRKAAGRALELIHARGITEARPALVTRATEAVKPEEKAIALKYDGKRVTAVYRPPPEPEAPPGWTPPSWARRS